MQAKQDYRTSDPPSEVTVTFIIHFPTALLDLATMDGLPARQTPAS